MALEDVGKFPIHPDVHSGRHILPLIGTAFVLRHALPSLCGTRFLRYSSHFRASPASITVQIGHWVKPFAGLPMAM